MKAVSSRTRFVQVLLSTLSRNQKFNSRRLASCKLQDVGHGVEYTRISNDSKRGAYPIGIIALWEFMCSCRLWLDVIFGVKNL